MTLITITAPSSGPVAARQGDLIIPGTEVAYGGFSSILGYKSTDAAATEKESGDREVYLLGMTASGLQLARVGMNHLSDFSKYRFWDPQGLSFSASPPHPRLQDTSQIYLPGTFSSGSIFFSPYFKTFIMVYFNKMVDSTFYIRYLQLNSPLGQDATWIVGGKNGKGLEAEDAEALVKYTWSAEQALYVSVPGPGGFNYAGMAHPEYFNTQYFPQSLYATKTPAKQRVNKWYGPGSAGVDGKTLLLSWTSQVSSYDLNYTARRLIHFLRRSEERTMGSTKSNSQYSNSMTSLRTMITTHPPRLLLRAPRLRRRQIATRTRITQSARYSMGLPRRLSA